MDWTPAVTTSTLLLVAAWFLRKLVITRLTASVQHEFNEKLANLQGQVTAKAAEINAMRSGVLDAMSGRHAAFDKRRLEAVDQIWAAATSLATARFMALMLTILKVDAITKAMETGDRKIQGLVDSLAAAPEMNSFDMTSAARARPFLTPMVWATFSAFAAVAANATAQWIALKGGLPADALMDEDKLKQLVTLALPLRREYVEEHGAVAAYQLFDEIESQLIAEIQRMLEGAEVDEIRARRAAELVALTRDLQTEADKAAAIEATAAVAAFGVAV